MAAVVRLFSAAEKCDILASLSHPIWQRKGGENVSIAVSFLISVAAGVVLVTISANG
jgi:hypothetical protein